MAATLDREQRRLTAAVLHTRRRPDEDHGTFARRRGREAAAAIPRTAVWSYRHAARVQTWAAHLRRPANAASWPAMLIDWRGQAWLRERRLAEGSASALGGRTATRSGPGQPATRWHDGVDASNLWLSRGRR